MDLYMTPIIETDRLILRIYVEHGIGGMKRYRILGYKNRMKNYFLKTSIIGVCAGLWNLKLRNRVNEKSFL